MVRPSEHDTRTSKSSLETAKGTPLARLLNCEEYCEVQQDLTSAARPRKMELEMVSLASLAAPLPFDHAPRARVSRCTLLMHAGHKPLDAQSCKTPARVVRNDPGG